MPGSGSTIVTAGVISFTPAGSALRWGAFPFIALCVWQCISTSIDYLVRSPWASLVGGHSVTLLFQYIDLVLLRRWTVELSHSNPRNRFWMRRFALGLSSTWNSRFVGTREQVKNVPRFSSTDPKYIPTRSVFLRSMATRILVSYVLLDILGASADPEVNARFYTLAKIPVFGRLGEISSEELLMRVGCVVGAAIGLVCTQGGIYCIFAVVGVLLGVSDPKDWPPFYGSIFDAYTLRGFWSCSWHQSNTHKLNSISRYLTYELMKIQPHTLGAKFTRMGVVFAVSGFMHFLIDISAGIPVYDSGAMRFFCTQIVGIIVEELFRAAHGLIRPQHKTETPSKRQRAVGYVWVGAFLVWSLPSYVYPMMYRGALGLDDSVVPVKLVQRVLQ
ncbi:hypothetical protein P170DRAFT_458457 [Aspergillus steynii IBT 23096]|uniref:Wax synthase domain-containing protein n=1 Tax=Aspergillus steynii IBT 23096 TaxID=1392250 RepID=A0A2I2FVW2_9EURO|nr:uncharacterized protein P170DRAFT_458457 [Aspergillus steynii IBT 23096]PLB44772.1 hypothetical protein P170DRAFT_458457 [Aspergillus steynii IBT 23096]